MRAVVQRSRAARVLVDGVVVGQIERGLVVLVGVAASDGPADASWMADKIRGLRIFADAAGKMNLDIGEAGGALLAISQFTLLGDARKGRRPSFIEAAGAGQGQQLYQQVVDELRGAGLTVATGIFQADMQVELVNDGPVTLLLDSRKVF
jgi:D-tyrosyl-tRNA(Tyr) deacylase